MYPPLGNVLQITSQQPSLMRYWFDKPYPEKSLLPHPAGPTPPDLKYLRLLTIKSLRPDRFYYALKAWSSEHTQNMMSIMNENIFDILKSINPARPVLLVNDTPDANAVDIVKQFASVSYI